MFKGTRKVIAVFVALLIIIVLAQYAMPRPTDWSRNFLAKNRSPFGCYAIYSLLEGSYARTTAVNNQTLYNLNARGDTGTSLLVINNNIELNKNDITALYKFLERGNSVFIAASQFRGALADSLHIATGWSDWHFGQVDSLIKRDGEKISFTAGNLKAKAYVYPQLLSNVHFTSFDTARFKVLARYGSNKACFIKGSVNKGTLYLLSMPDVFGNYFIAGHKNREVAYTMLSHIKNRQLVWDEYYKTFNVTGYSIIKFILDSDALYAAYLLTLLVIILYMVFEGRRRQRAIPLLVKPANSTLAFVNVISHVYYNSKNHHHIAAEKIRYFYETVRKKFGVDTSAIDELFIDEVTQLSGVERKLVKQLFVYTERIRQAAGISDHELAELNRQVHNFNKNSLR